MRQTLHQLPMASLEAMWRDFEPSDPINHRNCGYVPTGEFCRVCKKRLGKKMRAPYVYQDQILEDDHLTLLIAGGEQVGKSFTGAMKFFRILMAFLGEYQGRAAGEVAWLIGASYEQTAREFEYLKQWLGQLGQLEFSASEKVDPGEIRIKVPGGLFRVKTKSSDDAMAAIRMESPVAVLLCEAAIATFDTYSRLRSRVARARADFPGYGALVMISTFEGSAGWYPTLYSKWQMPAVSTKENAAAFSMPSFSNIFIYKGGEQDPEIQGMKADLSEDEYSERVLAVPAPPKGRVFSMFDTTVHILPEDAEYDPDLPVLLGVDPGFSGQPSAYAVEVFQKRKLPCGEPHYQGIDEIFEWQLTNDKVISIAMNRPWFRNEAISGAIDIAGTYHAGAQNPVASEWKRQSGLTLTSQKVGILPGIRRLSALFNLCSHVNCGEPVLVFSPRMRGAIAELGGMAHPFDGMSHPYRWATDRTGMVVGKTPEDKYCDAIKAMTYLFVKELGYTLHKGGREKIRVKKRNRRVA